MPEAHLQGECLAVIGGAEQILHVEHGPRVSPTDEATVGPIPQLLPIVRWRQVDPPYVVVLIDRTGADLFGIRRGSPDLETEIEGDHDELRKVGPGGWSQRRFQQRAEDSWEENAEKVAAAVERIVVQFQSAFVAVAGDVPAVQLLSSLTGDVRRATSGGCRRSVARDEGRRPHALPGPRFPASAGGARAPRVLVGQVGRSRDAL